jgi:hypothetical protein
VTPDRDEPLPDPEAAARDCTDAELEDYRRIFGEESRESTLARRELAARRMGPVSFGAVLIRVVFVAAAMAALYHFVR